MPVSPQRPLVCGHLIDPTVGIGSRRNLFAVRLACPIPSFLFWVPDTIKSWAQISMSLVSVEISASSPRIQAVAATVLTPGLSGTPR